VLSIPSHMPTIQEFPRPSIIKELQVVLGMVNFYTGYSFPGLPAWCSHSEMSSAAVGSSQLEQVEWSVAMEATFTAAKQALKGYK
jgi:hypothetical protein